MKKAAIISLTIIAAVAFTSCGGSRTACNNGYHGVTSAKANKKRQKEFHKPKHKIKKSKAQKRGN